MKKYLPVLLILCLSFYAMKRKQTTIYIIGDSTAANKKPEAFPETGWGMELQCFFSNEVKVDNRALNGRSTKSFINEKRWEPILTSLQKGDYVFIEFGHNDEKLDKPGIGTTLEEYRANLVKYVNETRVHKAIPVLMTPIARRNFVNSVLTDTHGEYPNVVRRVADSLKVPLIDMQQKTDWLLAGLGEEASIKLFNHVDAGHQNYREGKKDNTHLSVEGAKQVARLVAKGVKENKLALAKYLIKK